MIPSSAKGQGDLHRQVSDAQISHSLGATKFSSPNDMAALTPTQPPSATPPNSPPATADSFCKPYCMIYRARLCLALPSLETLIRLSWVTRLACRDSQCSRVEFPMR